MNKLDRADVAAKRAALEAAVRQRAGHTRVLALSARDAARGAETAGPQAAAARGDAE